MLRALLSTLLFAALSFAQWPSSPAENLLVCDHASEQALPKIAATSDGGCYITWWDLSSGNYDVYVQRLDEDGIPQWANPCGLLVSDHQQDTWLTDWDMIVDHEDHCIIAVNDIRTGNRDITAYRISPDGNFVWSADGFAVSSFAGFEPDPRIAVLEGGQILFAWQEETNIHLRCLTPAGADVFDPNTISFTQADGVSIPRIVAADSGSFVLSYLAQQGTQFTSPRHLYLRKYDISGAALWNPAGVPIMTTNGIGIQMRPDVLYDGAGGAYSYWYDARGNVHHCYIQHVNAAGAAEWTANGVSVDVSANELQMSPSANVKPGGVVVFYQTANTNQSMGGLSVQMIGPTGQRSWDGTGVTIVPLSAEPCFNVKALNQGDNCTVFYSQYAVGSQLNTLLRACQIDTAGSEIWAPAIKDLCSVASEKGRPNACETSLNQVLAAWPDSRTATMDIYAQNINFDGTLGSQPEFPPSINIISPVNNETTDTSPISLVFDVEYFDLDPDFGQGYVLLMVNSQYVDTLSSEEPYPVDLIEGSNNIAVQLVDRDYQPIDPAAGDQVNVIYTPRHPSIVITVPTQDTLVFSSPLEVTFTVEDFVVSDSMGDGYIHVSRISLPGPFDPDSDTLEFDHFSLTPVSVELIFFRENVICLSLVDNFGQPLVPEVDRCVSAFYGEVAVGPIPGVLPTEFAVSLAYPNPFNATVNIQYDVPQPADISLLVYDVTGREVATLFRGEQVAGRHELQWNANDLASGVYFVKLASAHKASTQKIMLLK